MKNDYVLQPLEQESMYYLFFFRREDRTLRLSQRDSTIEKSTMRIIVHIDTKPGSSSLRVDGGLEMERENRSQ